MSTVPRRRIALVLAASGACLVLVVLAVYALTHGVAPLLLSHYERFPALASVPKRTADLRGLGADPVNVAVVGSDSEVAAAFARAGWRAAQPVTRATSLRIAESVLLNRPDSAAPVSPLFLFGRPQDLAFEREVGRSARRRHHVRLWRVANLAYGGRPVWIGGATFDLRAGISHRALRPTHHIAPDVDEERDTLTAYLARAGQVAERFRVTGMGIRVDAHNADGDRFDTDGEMQVLVIPPGNAPHPEPPEPAPPVLVRLKDAIWGWVHAH